MGRYTNIVATLLTIVATIGIGLYIGTFYLGIPQSRLDTLNSKCISLETRLTSCTKLLDSTTMANAVLILRQNDTCYSFPHKETISADKPKCLTYSHRCFKDYIKEYVRQLVKNPNLRFTYCSTNLGTSNLCIECLHKDSVKSYRMQLKKYESDIGQYEESLYTLYSIIETQNYTIHGQDSIIKKLTAK